jgi:hypothetical protein
MIGSSTHYFDEKKDHHTLLHNTLNIGGCLYYTLVFAYEVYEKENPTGETGLEQDLKQILLYTSIFQYIQTALQKEYIILWVGIRISEIQKLGYQGYWVTIHSKLQQ